MLLKLIEVLFLFVIFSELKNSIKQTHQIIIMYNNEISTFLVSFGQAEHSRSSQ